MTQFNRRLFFIAATHSSIFHHYPAKFRPKSFYLTISTDQHRRQITPRARSKLIRKVMSFTSVNLRSKSRTTLLIRIMCTIIFRRRCYRCLRCHGRDWNHHLFTYSRSYSEASSYHGTRISPSPMPFAGLSSRCSSCSKSSTTTRRM